MTKIIRWTNKFSNEQGFVKSVRKSEGHFTNTYETSEAKVFSRQCDITKTMNLLVALGEDTNNIFEVVDAE